MMEFLSSLRTAFSCSGKDGRPVSIIKACSKGELVQLATPDVCMAWNLHCKLISSSEFATFGANVIL